MYPRVSQPSFGAVPPPGRASSYQQTSAPSSSPGLGIRVVIKPEFRISPPPQLSPQVGEIPRSTFQFDFDLEKKILAEAEKDSQNWSRLGLENLPSKALESTPSMGSTADPVVSKYIASGLSREAVPLAVANYGDNETKSNFLLPALHGKCFYLGLEDFQYIWFGNLPMATPSCEKWDSHQAMLLKL
ncbi:unnamed protein product, partial [Vitis vinifera]